MPEDLRSHHVDHLVPLAFLDPADPAQLRFANSPMNVRWLPARKNCARGAVMPTRAEIAAHKRLVRRWRRTL